MLHTTDRPLSHTALPDPQHHQPTTHTRHTRNNARSTCKSTHDKLNSRTLRSQPTKQIVVAISQQIDEPVQCRRESVSCIQSESVYVSVCMHRALVKPSYHSLFQAFMHALVYLASYSRSSSRTHLLISHALTLTLITCSHPKAECLLSLFPSRTPAVVPDRSHRTIYG